MPRATRDPELAAIVTSSVPLRYHEGADASLDRPAHVRAGSGLARIRGGVALIQDDANFIALIERDPLRVRALNLHAGAEGKRQFDASRGNKEDKLDLEACFSVDEPDGTLLVAMASGSKGFRPRETVVLVERCESAQPTVSQAHVPRLYQRLRDTIEFAGSQMNVEGAIHLGDRVRLFGRGNGSPRDGIAPVNATCDLDWQTFLAHVRDPARAPIPEPTNVVRYELGALGDIPLGFTDAAAWRGAVLYSAAAEDSPDVIEDGPVHGSAIGLILEGGVTRCAVLTDSSGARFDGKVEGILPQEGGARLLAVVDADDPDVPSMLCTVELRGVGW
jgi:hypothetical protein